MIFACTQENLLQGLSLVSHITGKNANLPILANVLMKVEDGNLKLSTTNLEMSVSALVRGRAEESGDITVPAKLLQDYVALLSPGKIELRSKDDTLEIRAEGKVTSMKGLPASEYPLLPKMTQEAGYRINAQALREAVNQVAFAVSTSESRPELGGVVCHFNSLGGENSLVMAATDSYRLSERTVRTESANPNKQAKCIVPSRTMNEIARVLSAYKDEMATPEEAEWSLADNQLVLKYGNVELISRLIEGSFPDYRQIIPTQFRTVATVKRTELAKAIRAASLFARQGLFDVHFEIKADGALTVSSSDLGTGSHSTNLEVEPNLEPNRVTINFKYIVDGLNAMSGEEILFQMIDAMNPVVIRPKDINEFQYIVMPIRQ